MRNYISPDGREQAAGRWTGAKRRRKSIGGEWVGGQQKRETETDETAMASADEGGRGRW